MKSFINGKKIEKAFFRGAERSVIVSDGKIVFKKDNAQIIPTDYILAYDFNGDVLDKSANANNGVKTGSGIFGQGRKSGTQCMVFNGVTCVRTANNLILNSDKVSISLWMKTNSSLIGVLFELSPNFNSHNAFGSFINDFANRASLIDRNDSYNSLYSNSNVNDNSWKHILLEIDRNQNGIGQNKMYINNNLDFIAQYQDDNNGSFANNILFIGQRNATQSGLSANLQDFKVFNRVLTPQERTQLYNE